MSLSKTQRERIIGDYLLGVEHPTYEVFPKNDGGFMVRKRKKKSPFSKKKLDEPPVEEPIQEEKKEPRVYDTVSVEEIAETLFNKLTALKEKKKQTKIPPPSQTAEEEDVDQTPLNIQPDEPNYYEYPYNPPEMRPVYNNPPQRPRTWRWGRSLLRSI
jgi:hypothetical protein